MASRPWTVAVLYGGVSAERAVSIDSGQAVAAALREAALGVFEVDICGNIEAKLDDLQGQCDAAFIALHGTFGEDGGIQRLLEARDIPYTGSGPQASRAAMDKQLAKAIFTEAAIPTPGGIVLSAPFWPDSIVRLANAMGYPVVVKPVSQGSSKGVSVVKSEAGIAAAVSEAAAFDDRLLLEPFLPGDEMTVGILNDAPLPVVQLKYAGEAFDYNAKYLSNRTRYLIDPPIAESLKSEVQRLAARAHAALGCRCFSRVDFRLDAQGNPCVLEVNTIPGLTSHSLLPKAAEHVGVSFVQLCKHMLASAFAAPGKLLVPRPSASLADGRHSSFGS